MDFELKMPDISTTESQAGDQSNNHLAARDSVAAANGSSAGSADVSDNKSPEDSASLPETIPAEASAPAEETSAPSSEELNQLMDQYAAPQQAQHITFTCGAPIPRMTALRGAEKTGRSFGV